jgi:hypothetical protein
MSGRSRSIGLSGLGLAVAVLIGAAGVAWGQPITTPSTGTPGAAQQDQAYAAHEQAIAADSYVECRAGGPTAQDSALAASVQGKLVAKMSGGLSAEQASCARAIYDNTLALGYDTHAAVIEICASITETSLLNLTGGTGSSVGLFQETAGKGSAGDRENPALEVRWFLNAMNGAYPANEWETTPVGTVDQGVELSAYPDRYQPNAGDAQVIVNALVAQETPPPPTVRVGVLVDNSLWVKEGTPDTALTAQWNKGMYQAGDALSFQISGNMIAVLTKEHHLFVKQGGLGDPWYDQTNAGNVLSYSVSGESGRVAVVLDDGNGTVLAKEGGPQAQWAPTETDHVKQVVVSGQWLGVVHDDGSAYVKQGNLSADWGDEQAPDVAELAMDYDPSRIGVIETNGDVWVKQDGVDGAWNKHEMNNASRLEISGLWIGVVDDSGNAEVKEGDLEASWTGETNPVSDQEVDYASGFIGVIFTNDGQPAWVKNHGLRGQWDPETNPVSQLGVTSFPSA